MDALVQFLTDWGYVGMFVAAFLAGSVVPLSSEAVLLALLLPGAGLNPVLCVVSATFGNLLGSLTCYWIGHLGKVEWLEKYFHIKKEKVDGMRRYLNGRGCWVAFFSFLPFVGDLISVALGFMRSNLLGVTLFMLAGKAVRFAVVAMAARGVFSFFA